MFPRKILSKRIVSSSSLELYPHQKEAVLKLKTGSILQGGVGTGKSLTAISYFYDIECLEMSKPKDLYIITTAQKRDTLDWEKECANFSLSRVRTASRGGVQVTVDSWNNISKYTKVKDAFFIFDEQRVVGSGSWVKSFYKITKQNNWILLSATPGDTWMDYIPAFVANGFYKNRTEFLRNHVVYNTFTKYPKVDRYVEEGKLLRLRNQIIVNMPYAKRSIPHYETISVGYDKEKFEVVVKKRWNPYTNQPIKEVGEFFYTMRKVINSDPSRVKAIVDFLTIYPKIIVFYNFNYELDILRQIENTNDFQVAEYNGHQHDPIPKSERWLYLVQYAAGSEGWNCIETNCIIFYSQNYSYRAMKQSAGRIDRLNTPFSDLYYYILRSSSTIDAAIGKALGNKRDFNENVYKRRVFS